MFMGLERRYNVCNVGLKAKTRWPLKRRERSAGHSSEGGRPAGHSSKHVSSSVCVLRPSHFFTKKGPRHRRKILANSFWPYSYFIQASPSQNKNIDYIFIYLRVFHCLSSGSICDIFTNVKLQYFEPLKRMQTKEL